MPLVRGNLQMITEKRSRFDFDLSADKYDSWYESAKDRMYDRLEKKAISRYLSPHTKGKKLLEVGCGTGHWSQFFSEYVFEVTGVDISERMINIARAKNIPNSSFQIADGHSLPFENSSFDVTAAITTLEFVCDAEGVLREMVRCTRKPSGQLLIGMLNVSARLNRNRQQSSESLYAKARLFYTGQIKKLLQSYGQSHLGTAGFIPRQKRLLPLSPFIDAVGRFFHLPYGVFIAGQVRL